MNAEHRFPTSEATMRIGRFVAHDPAVAIRGITDSLLGLWPKGTTAKNKGVQKNRERIMWGGMLNPVDVLYRMSLAAIDEGKDGLQWMRDMLASAERYKARHDRQTAGVIPFPEAHTRLVTRAIREDADADIAAAQVKAECIASLEKARAERLEAIAADEALVFKYTTQIAELRAGA